MAPRARSTTLPPADGPCAPHAATGEAFRHSLRPAGDRRSRTAGARSYHRPPPQTARAVPVRHVLFLCARNRLRSPTAEQLFADWPGIETASAGVNADADTAVTPELLAWADLIFVMERRHRSKLSAAFQRHLGGKRVVCLEIPDDYAFMDPALVRRLQQAVTPHLPRRHPAP